MLSDRRKISNYKTLSGDFSDKLTSLPGISKCERRRSSNGILNSLETTGCTKSPIRQEEDCVIMELHVLKLKKRMSCYEIGGFPKDILNSPVIKKTTSMFRETTTNTGFFKAMLKNDSPVMQKKSTKFINLKDLLPAESHDSPKKPTIMTYVSKSSLNVKAGLNFNEGNLVLPHVIHKNPVNNNLALELSPCRITKSKFRVTKSKSPSKPKLSYFDKKRVKDMQEQMENQFDINFEKEKVLMEYMTKRITEFEAEFNYSVLNE
jgi:hypothetical protein